MDKQRLLKTMNHLRDLEREARDGGANREAMLYSGIAGVIATSVESNSVSDDLIDSLCSHIEIEPQ